ncbi:MAG: hypothetical protein QHG99_07610 [Methanomicrobiales archaeon]|nr:hypothetical protein [Methanomicrobiales archaeon]
MGEGPRYDPGEYLMRLFPCPDPRTEAIVAFSLFDSLHTWVSLRALYGIPLSSSERTGIKHAVLPFQNKSGGFGSPLASMKETWQAAEVLLVTGYPLGRQNIVRFVHSCEDPEFGYLGRPDTRPSYLEDVYAGLRLSALLSHPPRYRDAVIDFLRRCRHCSGGYARSVFGGIATLEFTAIAVEAFAMLSGVELFHRTPMRAI